MQNFVSNLMPNKDAGGGGGGGGANDGVPWYMKYAAKVAGVLAGSAAIFFGLWCCIGFSVLCIVAGIFQMLAGFLVIVVEAPFCCMFLDFVQQISQAAEGRPLWQKAALYFVLAIPTLFLCRQFTTFVGSGALLGVSVIYAMQVIGKKGSAAEMSMAAQQEGQMGADDAAIMDGDQQYGQQYPADRDVMVASAGGNPSSSAPAGVHSAPADGGMKSNLVGNIHGQDVEAAKG